MTRSITSKRCGFTLMELLIVIIIIEVLLIPLIGVYLLPLRAQATLSVLAEVNRNAGLLQSHLSDDIRCADSISLAKAEGDRDDLSALDELRVERGAEMVVYRSTPEGSVEREVQGEIPLKHTFDWIQADFTLESESRLNTVRVDMILDYQLLRGPFKRQRTAFFSSPQEKTR